MNAFAKAIVAGLVAGYAVFELATTTSSAGGELITGNEWIRIAVTVLIAGLSVWAVPNQKETL